MYYILILFKENLIGEQENRQIIYHTSHHTLYKQFFFFSWIEESIFEISNFYPYIMAILKMYWQCLLGFYNTSNSYIYCTVSWIMFQFSRVVYIQVTVKAHGPIAYTNSIVGLSIHAVCTGMCVMLMSYALCMNARYILFRPLAPVVIHFFS